MTTISIILPNQLFGHNLFLLNLSSHIYLIEDDRFFTDYKFHKKKLIMHRASMKYYYDFIINTYSKEIKNGKKKIYYVNNSKSEETYKKIFSPTKTSYKIIHIYDPVDNHLTNKFNKLLNKTNNISLNVYDSPLFIETNDELQTYYDNLKSHTNYIHDNGFYKWQRKRLNILLDSKGDFLFGKLSFDHENRKPFDQTYLETPPPEPPSVINQNTNDYLVEAKKYVNKNWANNFGSDSIDDFIYPIDFYSAKKLFKQFLQHKLKTYGKYQDAVHSDINYGSHSILSASLNIGLISVNYILTKTLRAFNKLNKTQQKAIISSVEGFIRQLIGWRSYVRFIYKYHGDELYDTNQFKQKNKLPKTWFEGTTGIYPIDTLIKKVDQTAYAHHIERLMYLGNFALISQIKPQEIYDWFMICFIDSYEWVMIPNIMGMSQYSSDVIKMMTKPYFSSSNYVKNMSNFKQDQYEMIKLSDKEYYWNEIWDSLYYNFINANKDKLKKFYGTAYIVSHWNKKSSEEKKQIIKLANKYLSSAYAK
jgi:deoxyribodipyrimidine photolyase-related protein